MNEASHTELGAQIDNIPLVEECGQVTLNDCYIWCLQANTLSGKHTSASETVDLYQPFSLQDISPLFFKLKH